MTVRVPVFRTMPPISAARVKAFIENVRFAGGDDCWVYVGQPSARYPKVSIGGTDFSAHRVAWRLFKGELPDPRDAQIHHTCENKRCVNPRHLVALSDSAHKQWHARQRREAGGTTPARALERARA